MAKTKTVEEEWKRLTEVDAFLHRPDSLVGSTDAVRKVIRLPSAEVHSIPMHVGL